MASRQFRSDDTSKWFYGFGNGSDGAYSSSASATHAPIDSACTGTAGQTSLSATNASFAGGQLILIHQTRGTANVGKWELNRISSYTAGTITLSHALINTYAALSQVIVMPQYSSFTQNSGHTLTAKAWNGTVGGIIPFFCNGTTTITGTLSLSGKGYLGGTSINSNSGGHQAEGTSGARDSISTSANGNGGGGGAVNAYSGGGGGGGGYASAGSDGIQRSTGASGGSGGTSVGIAGLTTLYLGGGGGGGGAKSDLGTGGAGGNGGGIVLIITKNLAEITGLINVNGTNGNNGVNNDAGAGGGGAGGSVLIKCQTAVLGTNKITATAGTGGSGDGAGGGDGGAGAVGRIHLDYKTSYTGTTSPTLDSTQDTTLYYPLRRSCFV